ncbi:hypothetical protein ACIBP6_05450 [Nonomuraea terrae]|uniref:hypothetical protein n=1 Tax=Nonomuraea terrae TaxID=2530383 RepID=UPI00378E352F
MVVPEAFYATAAQVLPTILIALSIEIGFLLAATRRDINVLAPFLREFSQSVEDLAEEGYIPALKLLELQSYHPRLEQWALVLGATFAIGESLAFTALAFSWFNLWTFMPLSVCVLVLVAAAFVIPLKRLRAETPSVRVE